MNYGIITSEATAVNNEVGKLITENTVIGIKLTAIDGNRVVIRNTHSVAVNCKRLMVKLPTALKITAVNCKTCVGSNRMPLSVYNLTRTNAVVDSQSIVCINVAKAIPVDSRGVCGGQGLTVKIKGYGKLTLQALKQALAVCKIYVCKESKSAVMLCYSISCRLVNICVHISNVTRGNNLSYCLCAAYKALAVCIKAAG